MGKTRHLVSQPPDGKNCRANPAAGFCQWSSGSGRFCFGRDVGQNQLESPIPSEAFLAVAEVMSYVYKANNQPNPFDALLDAATGIKPDQDMKENDRGHN